MQILMISRLYYPHVGGVEHHLLNVNKGLLEKGHSVSVITENYNGLLSWKEFHSGVDIYRVTYPHIKVLGVVALWFNLVKYINLIKKADVIHIHDVYVWLLPYRLLFPNKRFFITFHGYESYPVKLTSMIWRVIAEHGCLGYICVGDFMCKWFGTKPDLVIYGAVDLSDFVSIKNRYVYDAIFVSRLDNQTGILDYIDAVRKLLRGGKKFKIVILGDGPLKIRRRAQKVGILKGFIEKPSQYFAKARLAFVSRYLAMLESSACKKKVFAVYDNPLKEDYLRMSPFFHWITIVNNSTDLADKVGHFVTSPNHFTEAVERGFRWSRNMTWEALTESYLKLWARRRKK